MDIPLLQEPRAVISARDKWQYNGRQRPPFADPVSEGQESVWDFPRPPAIERVEPALEVRHGDKVIAATRGGVRVLETAGAPTYYFPPEDVDMAIVKTGDVVSLCEWKGAAQSLLIDGDEIGWRYAQMFPAFKDLYLWPSFYPAKVACFVGTEAVKPQPGGFYGGWVTSNLVGPIKGVPGSAGW
ncbi:MAG: DUF427 domain-containing protein [Pseudomonadota bacterium]